MNTLDTTRSPSKFSQLREKINKKEDILKFQKELSSLEKK